MFHILNGDALKYQFPNQIEGDLIIARACLVDGPVIGATPEALYKTRDQFIEEHYEGYEKGDYFKKAVPEFEKIKDIPDGVAVNFWFEEDLFCQVNWWFVLFLFKYYKKENPLFLVLPEGDLQYGFGGMSESELVKAYQNRISIQKEEFDGLSKFWNLYQQKEGEAMLLLAEGLKEKYSFLIPAIKAEIDRNDVNTRPGRPLNSLTAIIKDLQTTQFGAIFREFSKRESIYGFGDLQVKRLLKELNYDHT